MISAKKKIAVDVGSFGGAFWVFRVLKYFVLSDFPQDHRFQRSSNNYIIFIYQERSKYICLLFYIFHGPPLISLALLSRHFIVDD